jgi:hypothetical protein
MGRNLISCTGEWHADAVEMAGTQLIIGFSWELDVE